MKRKLGGRGLISVFDCVEEERLGLNEYVRGRGDHVSYSWAQVKIFTSDFHLGRSPPHKKLQNNTKFFKVSIPLGNRLTF